jgi:hypothetical protein
MAGLLGRTGLQLLLFLSNFSFVVAIVLLSL